MTDPSDIFAGLDQPRPLSPELRAALEDQLLADPPVRALDEALAWRLTAQLVDPVAELLHGLDDPLPLPAAVRSDLLASLGRRRTLRRGWVAAAAAAGVAAAALGVLVLQRPGVPPRAQTASGVSPSSNPGQLTGGSIGAGGTTGGGTAGSPAPVPTAAPVTGVGPALLPGAAPAPPARRATVSVSPEAGPLAGGTTVVVHGNEVGSAQRVEFGSAPGTHLTRRDATTVSVVTPGRVSPALVTVRVVLTDGSVLKGTFRYLAAPTVDQVTPVTGPAAGGTWVTLKGTGLLHVTVVRFDGVAGTQIRALSDTELRVLAPAHPPGAVDVVATSAGGSSDPVRFVYLP